MTTKPGKHGTLYAYRINIGCDTDPDYRSSYVVWAYSTEHAELKFNDDETNELEGWRFISAERC
jgi:hypothetical protein